MFGSHLSIAGGMYNALIEAQQLGMEAVQVFTKNQRQWNSKPLTEEQIQLWKQHINETGIKKTVSHDSYLINLASPKTETLEKSIALYIDEIQRCEALGIPFLVMHPGAHTGSGEEAGLAQIIQSFDQIHKALPGYQTLSCLEITAGQGTTLGYKLEHLQQIIEGVKAPDRMAVCIDTAHALAAGYPLDSEAGAKQFIKEMGQTIGLDRIAVWHLNDSKIARGKRVDRHEHIGQGYVSLDAFKVIVKHRKFKKVPKILETPKTESADGVPMDTVNMEKLKGLMKS